MSDFHFILIKFFNFPARIKARSFGNIFASVKIPTEMAFKKEKIKNVEFLKHGAGRGQSMNV